MKYSARRHEVVFSGSAAKPHFYPFCCGRWAVTRAGITGIGETWRQAWHALSLDVQVPALLAGDPTKATP